MATCPLHVLTPQPLNGFALELRIVGSEASSLTVMIALSGALLRALLLARVGDLGVALPDSLFYFSETPPRCGRTGHSHYFLSIHVSRQLPIISHQLGHLVNMSLASGCLTHSLLLSHLGKH